MAYFSAEKSGLGIYRALILLGLTPGLLCELVLKDEFTFQIPALEIFPKTQGGLLYNRGYGCASEIFKLLPSADKWRKIFENIYPKMPENEFLAVYLCIIL